MGARRYEVTRTINAAAESVWKLLTDAGGYAAWNAAVISIEGAIHQGNTIKLVSIANPKRTFKLKVVEKHAANRMVWSDGMPLGLFAGRRTYTVTRADEHRCRFTMVEEFTGPLAGLITKAIPTSRPGDLCVSYCATPHALQKRAPAAVRAPHAWQKAPSLGRLLSGPTRGPRFRVANETPAQTTATPTATVIANGSNRMSSS